MSLNMNYSAVLDKIQNVVINHDVTSKLRVIWKSHKYT